MINWLWRKTIEKRNKTYIKEKGIYKIYIGYNISLSEKTTYQTFFLKCTPCMMCKRTWENHNTVKHPYVPIYGVSKFDRFVSWWNNNFNINRN